MGSMFGLRRPEEDVEGFERRVKALMRGNATAAAEGGARVAVAGAGAKEAAAAAA